MIVIRNNQTTKGFTLVETTIVLALISILTIVLINGASPQLKNERFSGNVRDFAKSLHEAQTKSYTVKSGDCTSAEQVAAPGSGNGCFWRGNVLEFVPSNPNYALKLLYGNDASAGSFNNDQRFGLTGRQNVQTYDLARNGLHINTIEFFDPGANAFQAAGPFIAIAFLAPDGHAFTCIGSTTDCDPSANTLPYGGTAKIRFTITDDSTSLTAKVIFDPANGTITTQVN